MLRLNVALVIAFVLTVGDGKPAAHGPEFEANLACVEVCPVWPCECGL